MGRSEANITETVETSRLRVVCDAGMGELGHPRVYLHINRDTGNIKCPYCSRLFVYGNGNGAASAAAGGVCCG